MSLSVFYIRFFTVSALTFTSYVMLDLYYDEMIFSSLSVAALVTILSYYATEIFTDILGEAIATMLYCYLADHEMMGEEGAQYVTPELENFLDQVHVEMDERSAPGRVIDSMKYV